MDLTISSKMQKPFRLLTVYRPPPSKENKLTSTIFFREFTTLLETMSTIQCKVLFAGDFNFHMDDENDREARHMFDILQSAGLCQHVKESTHKKGHTLDLIITWDIESFASKISIIYGLPSDHYASC